FFLMDAPGHLFHYSENTLRGYAKKFNFKIEKIRFIPIPGSFFLAFSRLFGKFIGNTSIIKSEISKENNIFLLISYGMFILFFPLAFLLNFLKAGDSIEIHLTK
ncbi:MAG: hypothetical protein ACK4YO_01675, partial [Candidatus Altarchaeaceae archaeon]